MLRKALFVGAVLSLLLAFGAATALAQGTGDPARGKTLWENSLCKNCHGAAGEGKYAGPRAGDGKTAAEWIAQVRTPRANMPSFSAAQISDQDITDMNAYMQTLTAPASFRPITYTPAEGDMPGKVVFHQKRCVACHGEDPKAFLKGRFTDQNREVTTEVILQQLRTPFRSMPAFSPTQVTDEQAGQIAEYLKSLLTPATMLPKTGGQVDWGGVPWLLALGGLALLGGGVAVLKRTRI
jgi:mono/diheme cytochrome c family protein